MLKSTSSTFKVKDIAHSGRRSCNINSHVRHSAPCTTSFRKCSE